ncbi:MAG: DUF5054 domain-containing protein [Terracidiphilus sp.]
MQRRDLLRTSALTLGGAILAKSLPAMALEENPPATSIKKILAMFKCHFDAGFIDTQAAVVHRYFNEYFPHAIELAEKSRQPGANRYVWTTGSWLVYEYLEQASPADRKRMEDAIAHGDIAWHALPFSWQTEMIDPSMISAGIALSKSLDHRFGRTTTGAKMTDVPGHTRGIIAPLASQGVQFLDIGVNGGSTTPDVPPLFVWKDLGGKSIVMMYHHDYGGVVRVPGSDIAVSVNVRGDNSGPHTADEVEDIYDDLHHQFPNAEIVATDLTEIANAVEPYRANFPVLTQEIGDTWIHGIASDPLKVARYREIARLRLYWIAQGKFQAGDATDIALLRRVLLEAEHTWGTDTKTWLDFDHYTPHDLALVIYSKNYTVAEFSWQEKRQDLIDGIATLPKPLHDEAHAAIRALEPAEPKLTAASSHAPADEIDTTHFLLAFDPHTGAIQRLRNKKTGVEWASPTHPIALFTYQTFSQADYAQFIANYGVIKADWFQMDFGKPNIEKFGAESREWQPTLSAIEVAQDHEGHRILAHLSLHDPEASQSGRVAFPQKLYLQLTLPVAEPVIHMELSWFAKPATRMPEAMWLTFNPSVPSREGWTMDKSGEQVSPLDVVSGGNRSLHAVSTGFAYRDSSRVFAVECIDAPLIAFGERSTLKFSRSQPDLSLGVHSNLFNNTWGTNYIMWFGEDMRLRYLLRA